MDEKFWRNTPKIFCDNANMAVLKGSGNTFLLALLSGGNAHIFAFTPEHIKRLSQMVAYRVKEYEDDNGEIKVESWTKDIKSPFQIDDLKK